MLCVCVCVCACVRVCVCIRNGLIYSVKVWILGFEITREGERGYHVNSLVIPRVEQVVDVDRPPQLLEGCAAAHGAEAAVFLVADISHGEILTSNHQGIRG